jgi:hypothetical protein
LNVEGSRGQEKDEPAGMYWPDLFHFGKRLPLLFEHNSSITDPSQGHQAASHGISDIGCDEAWKADPQVDYALLFIIALAWSVRIANTHDPRT